MAKERTVVLCETSVDLSPINFKSDSNHKYLVLAKSNEAMLLWYPS